METPLRLDLPHGLELSAVTCQFLCRCEAGWRDCIEELHIYTDGSSDKAGDTSGFGFAVFGWSPNESERLHTFVGWQGGQNVIDAEDELYVGAKGHSAAEAEATGLEWALIWLVQSQIKLPAWFHFDSKVIGLGAAGEWNYNMDNLQMRKTRELVHLVEEIRKGCTTQFAHVKAHSNQPCNDLVDAIAKLYKKGGQPITRVPGWTPLFKADCDTLSWAWWWIRGLRGEGTTPHCTLGRDQVIWSKEGYDMAGTGVKNIERKLKGSGEAIKLNLRVATYNVMTLRDRQTDQGQRGEDWKAALLRKQCSEKGISAIGIQESRATTDGLIQTADYIRFISGQEQGHHGCELWLAHTQTIGVTENSAVKIRLEDCSVLHSDGRILTVSCNIGGVLIIFFVVHAPS